MGVLLDIIYFYYILYGGVFSYDFKWVVVIS